MMSRKILFLSHKFHPDIGGIEINSEILANAFHQAGHQVKLITWSEDFTAKGFAFPVIRKPGVNVLLREHRWADIVFENNPSLRLSWPAIFFRKPLVIALRTWLNRVDGKTGWQDIIKNIWLMRASAVIAVSRAVSERCWPAATVIGNPYRIQTFKILADVPRIYDFVFLGRLVSDKGADLTIEAMASLLSLKQDGKTIFPNLSLTIVGDGPEREKLQELSESLGLGGHIKFQGTLSGDQLVHCLNVHRYILIPSVWEEPFGNVALEGMACGCIPIVSDGGGLPDAVGKAGLVFKRGNLADFVSCIREILINSTLKKQLLKAAANHLADHHPEQVSRRYLEVIETGFYK